MVWLASAFQGPPIKQTQSDTAESGVPLHEGARIVHRHTGKLGIVRCVDAEHMRYKAQWDGDSKLVHSKTKWVLHANIHPMFKGNHVPPQRVHEQVVCIYGRYYGAEGAVTSLQGTRCAVTFMDGRKALVAKTHLQALTPQPVQQPQGQLLVKTVLRRDVAKFLEAYQQENCVNLRVLYNPKSRYEVETERKHYLQKITYGCKRGGARLSTRDQRRQPVASAKCGCGFRLTVTVLTHEPDAAIIEEVCNHTNHVPDSVEDLKFLDTDHSLEERMVELLRLGLKPKEIFGRDIALLYATGGTNKYGYPFFTMLIKDDFGNGVPVAFMICNTEEHSVIAMFLKAIAAASGVLPKNIMMDKSAAEIKAVQSVGANVLLCYFHLMQDWERHLKKSVRDAGTRKQFANQPANVKYLQEEWLPCYGMWADCGRQFAHRNIETNNLLERFFRTFKYMFMKGVVNRRLSDLINFLMNKVVPFYYNERRMKLADRYRNRHLWQQQQHQYQVEYLLGTNGCISVNDAALGSLTVISLSSDNTNYTCMVPELSCTCKASLYYHDLCKHAEASARACHVTPDMTKVASTKLVANGCVDIVDEKLGLATCKSLLPAQLQFDINVFAKFCNCIAFRYLNVCCHLLAVSTVLGISSLVDGELGESKEKSPKLYMSKMILKWGFDINKDCGISQPNTQTQQLPGGGKDACAATAHDNAKRALHAIKSNLSYIPDEHIVAICQDLCLLADRVRSMIPAVQPTAKRQQKRDRRKASDRHYKALFNRRKQYKPPVAEQDNAGEPNKPTSQEEQHVRIKKAVPVGRPKTVMRGQTYTRTSKRSFPMRWPRAKTKSVQTKQSDSQHATMPNEEACSLKSGQPQHATKPQQHVSQFSGKTHIPLAVSPWATRPNKQVKPTIKPKQLFASK
eukprot:jgi/Chlat1/3445/Chrsp23S03828